MDPTYLAALQEVTKIEGARRFAVGIELVARIFSKTPAQVIQDACAEVPA
jgi:hypothetical protein